MVSDANMSIATDISPPSDIDTFGAASEGVGKVYGVPKGGSRGYLGSDVS